MGEVLTGTSATVVQPEKVRAHSQGPLVAVDELLVTYVSRFGEARSVGPYSLSAHPGEVVLLSGPNGSGKSTILRAIAGFIRFKGAVRFATQPRLLPQNSSEILFPWLTLEQHIEAFGSRRQAQHVNNLMRLLQDLDWPQCNSLRESTPAMLSGGLRQTFGLAFVLSFPESKIFLLDEPLASLDADRRKLVGPVLEEAVKCQGKTVLLSSHLDPGFLTRKVQLTST